MAIILLRLPANCAEQVATGHFLRFLGAVLIIPPPLYVVSTAQSVKIFSFAFSNNLFFFFFLSHSLTPSSLWFLFNSFLFFQRHFQVIIRKGWMWFCDYYPEMYDFFFEKRINTPGIVREYDTFMRRDRDFRGNEIKFKGSVRCVTTWTILSLSGIIIFYWHRDINCITILISDREKWRLFINFPPPPPINISANKRLNTFLLFF